MAVVSGCQAAPSRLITKLQASDGAKLLLSATPDFANSIAFDGATIWLTNQHQRPLSKMRAGDGALLGTFLVGSNPVAGLAFDGANIWCRIASTTRLPNCVGAME